MFVMKRVDLKPHGHPSIVRCPRSKTWVCAKMGSYVNTGKDTPDNVYKRMREGWEARPASSVKNQLF